VAENLVGRMELRLDETPATFRPFGGGCFSTILCAIAILVVLVTAER